jgi:hypothetical protein
MTRRLVYVVIAIALGAVLMHQYRVRIRHQMVDFEVYRTSAIRVAGAEPLYRPADGHYQLKYLPAFAMAMTPLRWMPDETAKIVWFVLSIAFLLWLVWASVEILPFRRLPKDVLFLITLVLMAKFFGHELTLGQANALLGAMLIAAIFAMTRSQPIAGALLIGASVFVKPYAVLLWPWLAYARGRRPAALTGFAIVAGLLLPVTLYGWSGNLALLAGWWHTVSVSTAPNLLDTDNVSLAAMWAKWFGIGAPATTLALISTVALLFFVVAVIWRGRTLPAPAFLEAAALMLMIPLVSPQGWDYVLLLGTPAVALVVDRWRELTPPWRIALVLALATMSLTTFDTMGRTAYVAFMNMSLVTIAALTVIAALGKLRVSGDA